MSILVSGACFLLRGTDGIDVCDCFAAGGGKGGLVWTNFGAGTEGGVGVADAEDVLDDAGLGCPTCSLARRFARIWGGESA